MSRMQDKRCLVSGAARGIGLAVCERLIEEGAQVMMADIDAASGETQAQRLGEHAVFQPLDVTRDEQWDAALDAIDELGRARPDIQLPPPELVAEAVAKMQAEHDEKVAALVASVAAAKPASRRTKRNLCGRRSVGWLPTVWS